ncbi:MAG: hypothetical protein IJN90_01490 [Bacilli bacterium]|nr:hypothetical protein [Bacilli bacterium]
MQKFRDYIYCDINKINSYISQISELNKLETSSSYERETAVEGGLDFKLAKTGTTLNEKTSTNFVTNNSPLEKIVNWACNRKNAINYEGEKLEADDIDKLIVISGKLNVPEMSENMEIINSLAQNTTLFDMIPMSEDDRKKMAFIKETENIPILLELDSDYIFNCNLKRASIIGDKNDFFDNIEDDITIIGRIDRVYNNEENIEIYDLAKEVFKLNRTIRRKIPKENLEKAIIFESGPLVKITPIIIYK